MFRTLTICSLLAISLSAYAGVDLKAVHPDESADFTFYERLSTKHSLESLAAIKSALDSFRKLTKEANGKISKGRLAKIGNTDWETQNLAFVNHVEAVRGTLLKQDYLIHKLKYELAEKKSKSGEIDQNGLLEIKREYDKAEKQFRQFWEAFGIAD